MAIKMRREEPIRGKAAMMGNVTIHVTTIYFVVLHFVLIIVIYQKIYIF